MLGNSGPYANKKRKKPVLKQKKLSEGNEAVKSNPSKRHRDRLNGELERLTDLLPFPAEVRSRLDKLSVLRLSVGYLRAKTYFKANMRSSSSSSSLAFPGVKGPSGNKVDVAGFSEGDLLLQALNGFVMVITAEGTVFYSSATIKDYLGFQQSDVVHQSVFEFIHTDDRDTFRQQLHFALDPPAAADVLQGCAGPAVLSPEQLPPENSSFLERSFVCRFRCLLDNSSGFLALQFQGRLKYLHGQRDVGGGGARGQPQLALFTIAVPVQAPAIVEIRAKMLLFQSKHKLDFTPMGIDSRGKIILGYSEVELCMKGSGYQFIHAADMMYCADNHIRMIKTGESGLTVFRLLSKSGGWVWVKANAKLIYKGGRPDFIIAYQRALVNAEGEEHLRQRRLQLPFSSTTGEAVLYDSGPTVDVSHFHFNKMFGGSGPPKDVAPGSLLGCFLRQDEAAYTHAADPPLPVDQVFMDSRALVSIPSAAGPEGGGAVGQHAVKEETKQLVAVIDSLGKIAQRGDFCTLLQDLEEGGQLIQDLEGGGQLLQDLEGGAELLQWETAVKSFSQSEEQQPSVSSELDSILTDDIFHYIDSILFKQNGDDGGGHAAFSREEPPLGQTAGPHCIYAPTNGVYAHQQDALGGLSSPHRLSHHGPLPPYSDTYLPPLQQLQLQDIFSPSIELPELTVPSPAPLQSCGQTPAGHMCPPQTPAGHMCPPLGLPEQSQCLLRAQSGFQLLQSSTEQQDTFMDVPPPLVPCSDLTSCSSADIPLPLAASCPPPRAPGHQVQRWLQQRLHHVDVGQNGLEAPPPRSQTPPHAAVWCRSVAGLTPPQQGGLACGQAAAHSSCMFNPHFSSGPAGGDVLALSGPADTFVDQSPPQASGYFQWSDAGGSSAMSPVTPGVIPAASTELSTPASMPEEQL